MAGQLFSRATINFEVNTQNALQQITGFQRNFSNSVGQMKNLVSGFVGYRGIKGAYDSLLNIIHTADRWHLPVEKVSQFANMFAKFGGDAEDATRALAKFEDLANNLTMHSDGTLRQLGANLRANLNNKDYWGIIQTLRGQWPHLTVRGKNDILSTLGITEQDSAFQKIIESSNDKFNAAWEESAKNVLTEDQAKSMRTMEEDLAQIRQALTMTVVPVLNALKPILDVLQKALDEFNKLPQGTRDNIVRVAVGAWVAKLMGFGGGGSGAAGSLINTGVAGGAGAVMAGGATAGAGLAKLAKIGLLIDALPDLITIAEKLYDFINGKGINFDFEPSSFIGKATKWVAKKTDDINKTLADNINRYLILKNPDEYDENAKGEVISYLLGQIRDKKISVDEFQEKADKLFPKSRYVTSYDKDKNQFLRRPRSATKGDYGFVPFADPNLAYTTWRNAKKGDTITTINIYGVKGAEEAIDRLRSVAEQTLTPRMGAQG